MFYDSEVTTHCWAKYVHCSGNVPCFEFFIQFVVEFVVVFLRIFLVVVVFILLHVVVCFLVSSF